MPGRVAESQTGCRLVLTTAPSAAEAERLAGILVEERLAACVNIVSGVRSIYRWQGAVERGEEALLLLKTTGPGLARLRARLLDLHPYDTPEFVAFEVSDGSPDYLRWVAASVGSPAPASVATAARGDRG